MKKCIAGNWKMNLDQAQAIALAQGIKEGIKNADIETAQYIVCPPFVYLRSVIDVLKDTAIAVGAQDCAAHDNGAYTGDVSAAMLKDIGVSHVILGHSERRSYHNEQDELIKVKAEKAHAAGLTTIICVGETESQRAQGQEQEIVASQLTGSLPDTATVSNTIIAYEPVWAIGTGKTATPADAGEMHQFIRSWLADRFDTPEAISILYGGSMKPGNAADLLSTPDIDGGLIGGASLKPDSFLAIGRSVGA